MTQPGVGSDVLLGGGLVDLSCGHLVPTGDSVFAYAIRRRLREIERPECAIARYDSHIAPSGTDGAE